MRAPLLLIFCATLFITSISPTVAFARKGRQYEDPDFPWETMVLKKRDMVHYPKKAVRLMDLKPGDFVADIGPGPGYWTFYFAKAVGVEGRVYAIDVDADYYPGLMKYMAESKADRRKNPYDNVRLMRALEDSIGMPPESLDAVFLCQMALLLASKKDTYSEDIQMHAAHAMRMEISRKLVKNIYGALKPGGRLFIIDMFESPVVLLNPSYTGGPEGFDRFIVAKNVDIVKQNYEEMGFRFKEEFDLYANARHRKNIERFRKLPVYKTLSEKDKIFFVNEMFFLVFEKPGVSERESRIIISSDKDVYKIGDTIKIKAEYGDMPEDSISLRLKDGFIEIEEDVDKELESMVFIPEVTHQDGKPVRVIELNRPQKPFIGRKRLAKELIYHQPRWKIEKKRWKDPYTGKQIYEGVGFEGGIAPNGTRLYCLSKVPGKYKIVFTRQINTSDDPDNPSFVFIKSNPITIEVVPFDK